MQPGRPGAAAQNPAAQMIMDSLTRPRPGGLNNVPGAPGLTVGGGIAGVATTFEGESIKIYNERQNYNEWEFIYDIKNDKRIARQMGMPQGNQPGQPLTGQPGAPPGVGNPAPGFPSFPTVGSPAVGNPAGNPGLGNPAMGNPGLGNPGMSPGMISQPVPSPGARQSPGTGSPQTGYPAPPGFPAPGRR
jgi:hypothetical protein